MRPTRLLFFALLTSLCMPKHSEAKNRYLPGYVILNSGDTLHGSIMDRKTTFSGTELLKKLRFKGNDGKNRRYTPYDLIGYSVDGTTFVSMWFDTPDIPFTAEHPSRYGVGEKVFLRVLRSGGKLSCYMVEYMDQDAMSVDGYQVLMKEGDDVFVKASNGIFGLKKKKLASYLSDCPILVEKIEKGEIKSVLEVVDYYNDAGNVEW